MTVVHHRYATVDGRRLFYREAGDPQAPAIVLLHGFPTSSFMFRDLIPALADSYHVSAPDYLGFGYSDAPPIEEYEYTFDALADLTAGLLAQLGVGLDQVDQPAVLRSAGPGEAQGARVAHANRALRFWPGHTALQTL